MRVRCPAVIRRLVRSHPGGLAVTAIATVCAVIITFPAPFPGHVVSSNDVIRQATPYATQGGPVDAIRRMCRRPTSTTR